MNSVGEPAACGAVWLGDLVRALGRGGEPGLAAAARALGLVERPAQAVGKSEAGDSSDSRRHSGPGPGSEPDPTFADVPVLSAAELRAQLSPIPFWHVTRFALQPEAPRVDRPAESDAVLSELDQQRRAARFPAPIDLLPWPQLWRRLRTLLRAERPGRRVDVARLVDRASRGREIRRVPRLPWRGSTPRTAFLLDRAERLAPFWGDQDRLLRRLRLRLGAHAVEVWTAEGRTPRLRFRRHDRDGSRPGTPEPGIPVVVLGDLGVNGTEAERFHWTVVLRTLARASGPLHALVSSPRSRWRGPAFGLCNALLWDREAGPEAEARAPELAERLLRLVAPAVRVDYGVLRAARAAMRDGDAHCGVELDACARTEVALRDPLGIALDTGARVRWMASWRELPEAERRAFVQALEGWHDALVPELGHEESLTIASLHRESVSEERLRSGLRYFERLANAGERGGGELVERLRPWFHRSLRRLPEAVWTEPDLSGAVQRAERALRTGGSPVPDGALKERETRVPDAPFGSASLVQSGKRLLLGEWPASQLGRGVSFGSPLGVLEAGAKRATTRAVDAWIGEPQDLVIGAPLRAGLAAGRAFSIVTDVGNWDVEPLRAAELPGCTALERDEYGLVAEFEVAGLPLRMRWVPPGRFLMGSPPGEAGRSTDETQHEVVLTKGYWLAETPLTQALWAAVLGENPSEFKHPQRPVDSVTWEEVHERFLGAVESQCPGLDLRLPTEAEWEYACRAGTRTATYAGDLEILGDNNAPVLDAIAWYGGNSGEGYELKKGFDSSDWPQKQYRHRRTGTRIVRSRCPNGLGLYDMLGNVLEWCEDRYGPYPEGVSVDPAGPDGGSFRGLRGGSWFSDARDVRAANRDGDHPGGRSSNVGFRPARGQVPDQPSTERAASRRASPGDPGEARRRSSPR